jgi:hypothetical protein
MPYGPTGYGPPPPWYGPAVSYGPAPYVPPARPTNSNAVLSLVLGVLSIFSCCFLLGVPAIILGVRARRQVAVSGEQGDAMALAGIITSLVTVVLTVVFVVVQLAMGAALSTLVSPLDRVGTNRPPATVAPRTGTTSRSRGTTTTSRPGPRSTALPAASCARLRSSFADLDQPETSTRDRLNTSARTLQGELGAERLADIETVLVDGLSRVGQRAGADRPPLVAAAADRLAVAVDALCPP